MSSDRRDVLARASRDAVANRLELHPRRLGSLPREVVEAMEMRLLEGRLRRRESVRSQALDLVFRARALERELRRDGDAEAAGLAARICREGERLTSRLVEEGAGAA